jgi:hypothetical protein
LQNGQIRVIINKSVKKSETQYKQLRKLTLLGETFLTNREVCTILGLRLSTLQDYRERGHLAYYKIEGKILYKLSDVLQMLENNYFDVWKRRRL